jgi:thiol-disulfide isomerase/thioredoxin
VSGKDVLVRLAAICAACAPAAGVASGVAAVGRTAPAFVLEDERGKEYTLNAFAGKPLVLNVFASWCPPCRQELPGIVAAARTESGHVAFLGIDEQEPVQMGRAFARSMAIPYPVAYDHGQFAASYGAASLPETIFVDADGKVTAIVHGAIARAVLERELKAVQH